MPNIDTLSIQFSAKGTKTAANNIREMGQAVRSLATNLNAIDGNKMSSFVSSLNNLKKSAPTKGQGNNLSAFSKIVGEMGKSFESVSVSKLSAFASSMTEIKKASITKSQATNLGTFNTAVSGLSNVLGAIDGNKVTTLAGLADGMNEIKKSIPGKSQIDRLTAFTVAVTDFSNAIGAANIGEFSKDMAVLGDAVQNFKKSSVNSITNAVTAMQQLGSQAQSTANIISDAMPKNTTVSVNDKPTVNHTREIIASLEKVQIKATGIQGAMQKIGLVVPTKKFKDLENGAEKVRQKYEQVRAALQKGLDEGTIETGGTTYKKKMAELDALRNKYDELIQKQKELSLEGFTLNPNIQKAYSGIKETVSGVKQTFNGISSAVGTVNKHISSFIGKLRSLGSQSKKTKRDTGSLADGAKKLANEFFRVSKMLKLMVTRMALRAVIKEVGNGFKSLAIHSEEFNNSMSNVINGSKKLGYSFAALVSPLINALAPAIVYVINLLTKLVNIVQQVFASLTGASTWNRAKDFTDSWADSIQETSKNAKELKKTVLGFDQLNQLQDNKSSDSGSGIKDMFETVDVDSKWKNVADKIKSIAAKLFDPIKNAWEKVGDFVKESWKYAMDEVLKLAKSVGRDFLKVWEQEKTQKIFENILETIGWIGVAIGNLAKRFREAWDENDTGLHILEAIRDIILIITEHIKEMAKATADWADKLDFKPLLTSIQSWLESLKPAVDAVMGILEDFYSQVVLKFTKWVIESGLPKLIDVFKRFNDEVKWDLLRERLSKLWDHLEPFMETVGEGLIIFIERVTSALAKFVNGDKFADFLEKLGKWMDSVEPEDVADAIERFVKALIGFKVAGVIASALSGLAPILSAIFATCKGLGSIASGLSTFVNSLSGLGSVSIGISVPLSTLAAVIGGIVTAMYSFVQSYGSFEGAWKKLKETLNIEGLKKELSGIFNGIDVSSLIDAFNELKTSVKNMLGSLGDMKDMWDIILGAVKLLYTPFIQGILTGLKGMVSIIKSIISAVSHVVSGVSSLISVLKGVYDAIAGVFTIFKAFLTLDFNKGNEGAKRLFDGIYEAANSFGQAMAQFGQTIIDLVVAPWKTIKYLLIGDPIVIDMWNGITKVFEDSIKAIVDFVVGLKDKAVEIFTNIKTSLTEKIDAIKAKLTEWGDKFRDIKEKVSNYMNEVKENASKRFEDLKSNVSSFKDKWSENWDAAKRKLEDFKRDGLGIVQSIKDAFSKDKWTFSGVAEGLKTTFQDAKDGIKGIWNSIAEKLNGEHDVGGSSFHINLPTFAHGGFPEDGLFMANHHELVGNFSNGKTAVANNQQIIAGIESGVYNAMVKANGQGGDSKYIANEIIVDGEVLARSVTKAQEKQNRRYSPSMA